MKIETLLHNELENEFGELSKLKVGSEEWRTAVDGIAKLTNQALEIDKLNVEYQDRIEAREAENDLKLKQMKDDKIDRIVKNGLTFAGIAIPTGVTIWGALKSWEFEKEGTVTSALGRIFMQRVGSKK